MVKGDKHTTLDCQLSVNLRRSLDGSYQYIPRPHLISLPSKSTNCSPRQRPHPRLSTDPKPVQPHKSKASTISSLSRPLQNHHHFPCDVASFGTPDLGHHACVTPQSSNHMIDVSEITSPQWHDASDPCTIIHMPMMMMHPHAYHPSPMSPQMSTHMSPHISPPMSPHMSHPMTPQMTPVYYHLPPMNIEGGTSPHHFHHHQPPQPQDPGAFWYTHDTNIHTTATATHSTSSLSTMEVSMTSSMTYPVYDTSNQDHLQQHMYATRSNHTMVPMPMMMMSPMANDHPSTMSSMPYHHEYPIQMHTEERPHGCYSSIYMEREFQCCSETQMEEGSHVQGGSQGGYPPMHTTEEGYQGYPSILGVGGFQRHSYPLMHTEGGSPCDFSMHDGYDERKSQVCFPIYPDGVSHSYPMIPTDGVPKDGGEHYWGEHYGGEYYGGEYCHPTVSTEEIPEVRVYPSEQHADDFDFSLEDGVSMPLSMDLSASNHHPHLPASPIPPSDPVSPINEMNLEAIVPTISTMITITVESSIESMLAPLIKEKRPPTPVFVEIFLENGEPTFPVHSA